MRSLLLMLFLAIGSSMGVTLEPQLAQGAVDEHERAELGSHALELPKNQIIVLQFWASWCQSCAGITRQLNAQLESSTMHHRAISIDKSQADAEGALAKFSYQELKAVQFIWDQDREWAARFNAVTVPTVIVLDAQGKERFRQVGHFNAQDWLSFSQALAASVVK